MCYLCGNGCDVQKSLRHRRRYPILGGVSAQEGWRTGAGALLSPQSCVLKGVLLALWPHRFVALLVSGSCSFPSRGVNVTML